jgi:hypothetical protein
LLLPRCWQQQQPRLVALDQQHCAVDAAEQPGAEHGQRVGKEERRDQAVEQVKRLILQASSSRKEGN